MFCKSYAIRKKKDDIKEQKVCSTTFGIFWQIFFDNFLGILKQLLSLRNMIRSCNRLMTSFKEVDWWRHFQYLITSSYIGSWSVNYTSVTWPSQLCQQSSSLHNGYISGTKFRFIPCLEVYILGGGVYTPPSFPCMITIV